MKISIYGAGYVGIISSVCFAHLGHSVLCYDIEKERIEKLKLGLPIIHEIGLEEFLLEDIIKKKIQFSADITEAINFADFHIVCVGTPEHKDGSADLKFVHSVIDDLGNHLNKDFLLIIKSTVPPGTVENLRKRLDRIFQEKGVTLAYDIAFVPEFLSQGEAIHTFMEPDRIVIGTDHDATFEKVRALYAPLTENNKIPIIRMTNNSAELTKYATNAFLATKISFMNELSRIAESTGADINEVIEGLIYDRRIGPFSSKPGCGFGGSCLPKDLKALISLAKKNNCSIPLIQAAFDVNEYQKNYFINKVVNFFDNKLEGKVVAIWGLSFKPNTDDIRMSVSCELIDKLLKGGAILQVYDPTAEENVKKKFPSEKTIHFCENKEAALNNADALVVTTEWKEFYDLDFELLKRSMKHPVIFDGRNIYRFKKLSEHGIWYFCIGHGLHI